jgi:hypothetical protein
MTVRIGILQYILVHERQMPYVGKGPDIFRAHSGLPVKVTVEGTVTAGTIHQATEKPDLDLLKPIARHSLDLFVPIGTVGHKRKFRVPSFGFRVKG